jgi:hypothetical protein
VTSNDVFSAPPAGDVWLTEAHLSAARRVLSRVLPADRVRLAFVSGSFAAGLGHDMSDIDLYVAADGTTPVPSRGYREDGFVVQITPLSSPTLDLIASLRAGYTATAKDRGQIELGDSVLRPVLRYSIGTVLANADPELPTPQHCHRTLRQILMTTNAYLISNLAEDVLGTLRTGDTLTALQASAMALEHTLECALAGAGDIYAGRKFLLRRAARVAALRDVLPTLWELWRPPASGDGIEELVLRRMLFASHLVAHAMLSGWDSPTDRFPAFTDRRTDGGPTRSPWTMPVRFADSWGMAGPDIGYRVTPGMVRLWHLLDGRPLSEVRELFAAAPADKAGSRELLDHAVAQLVEKKAAVPGSGALR